MAKRTVNTKLKRFLIDNKVIGKELSNMTKITDDDGFGISPHHLYLIQNGNIQNTGIRTIVMICKALTKMLNKQVTPNDLIDY